MSRMTRMTVGVIDEVKRERNEELSKRQQQLAEQHEKTNQYELELMTLKAG